MESESIHIEVYEDSSVFRCEFIFLNHDTTAMSMLVGFPARSFDMKTFKERNKDKDFWGAVEWDDLDLHDFRCWVNGKETGVSRYDADRYSGAWAGVGDSSPRFSHRREATEFLDKDYFWERYRGHLGRGRVHPGEIMTWFAWPVTFQPLSETRIVHTYRITNSFVGGYPNRWFRYVLTTGKYWKDNSIGSVDVVAHFNFVPFFDFVCEEPEIQPDGYEFGSDTIEWHLADYTPSEDISITWWDRSEEVPVECPGAAQVDADHRAYRSARNLAAGGNLEAARTALESLASESPDPRLRAWAGSWLDGSEE
jgi:hypothetical protein